MRRTLQRGRNRKWTPQEESRLKNQVRVFPQNLHRCFMIVAEEIDRSPSAVANHWYSKTSKDPEFLGFFTASEKHFSRNRKNGEGVPIRISLWRRLISLVRNL